MTVDYPLPVWRSMIPSEFPAEGKRLTGSQSPSSGAQKFVDQHSEPSHAYLFVLFVRLPSWSKDDRELTPEIKTLRNLKNGIEVYRVKASMELSTGLPAHVTRLLDVNDKKYLDDTRLIIGENVRSGGSLRLQIISAWEEVIKAAWTNDLSHLIANLPAKQEQEDSASTDKKQFASVVAKSGNEHAFCALFAASAKGHLEICKAILEAGYDPNQSTFFGNSSLHTAAYNGQFEVIQMLISHGANIRCINSQKKTPLDIAASCDNIDCARWLWLNQWNAGVSKKEEEPPKASSKPSTEVYISPSKPLEECSTLFTKSKSPILPPMISGSATAPSIAKSSNLRESIEQRYHIGKRPETSPVSWRLNTLVSFSKNNRFQTYAETKRPFTAAAKKGDEEIAPKSPRLLPQLSAGITRGRSIPSVQESRSQKPSIAQLMVDSKARSIAKPISIHMPLTGHWINPRESSSGLDSPRVERLNSEMKFIDPLNNNRKKQVHFPNTMSASSLHSDSSDKTTQHKSTSPRNELTKENVSPISPLHTSPPAKPQDFDHQSPANTDINVNFVTTSPKLNTNDIPLEKDQLLLGKTKHSFNKTSDMLEVDKSKSEAVRKAKKSLDQHPLPQDSSALSRKSTPADDKSAQNHNNKSAPVDDKSTRVDDKSARVDDKSARVDDKSARANHDSYVSLHGGGQLQKSTAVEEKKFQPNSIVRTKTPLTREKEKDQNSVLIPPTQTPKTPQHKPQVKEKVYDRYKRDENKTESKSVPTLSREQQIRKEKNKTAWAEWIAAKQKVVAQKKKHQEEAKKQQDRAVQKWGMTFDEWIAEKKRDAEKKTTEIAEPAQQIPAKKQAKHANTSGKTFETWMKEKQEEKSKELSHKPSEHKPSEEEIKKAEEARQRNFALWSARKFEEAKRDKEKRGKEEKQRVSSSTMHDKRMSKEMSFEIWKKKKEEARKLKMVDQAQEEEQEYFSTWSAEQRKEESEKAFQKWMKKKNSVMLQEAESELEEAKKEREDTEHKLKLRKALLRAKIIFRWEQMTKSSSKLERRKSSRLLSSSLSTGNLADDAILSVDEDSILAPHSEDEKNNSRSSQNFQRLVFSVKKRNSKSAPHSAAKTRVQNEEVKSTTSKKDTPSSKSLSMSKPLKSGSSSSSSSSSDSESASKLDINKTSKKIVKRKKKTRKNKSKQTNSLSVSQLSEKAPKNDSIGKNSAAQEPEATPSQSQTGTQKPSSRSSTSRPTSTNKKPKTTSPSPYFMSLDTRKITAKTKVDNKTEQLKRPKSKARIQDDVYANYEKTSSAVSAKQASASKPKTATSFTRKQESSLPTTRNDIQASKTLKNEVVSSTSKVFPTTKPKDASRPPSTSKKVSFSSDPNASSFAGAEINQASVAHLTPNFKDYQFSTKNIPLVSPQNSESSTSSSDSSRASSPRQPRSSSLTKTQPASFVATALPSTAPDNIPSSTQKISAPANSLTKISDREISNTETSSATRYSDSEIPLNLTSNKKNKSPDYSIPSEENDVAKNQLETAEVSLETLVQTDDASDVDGQASKIISLEKSLKNVSESDVKSEERSPTLTESEETLNNAQASASAATKSHLKDDTLQNGTKESNSLLPSSDQPSAAASLPPTQNTEGGKKRSGSESNDSFKGSKRKERKSSSQVGGRKTSLDYGSYKVGVEKKSTKKRSKKDKRPLENEVDLSPIQPVSKTASNTTKKERSSNESIPKSKTTDQTQESDLTSTSNENRTNIASQKEAKSNEDQNPEKVSSPSRNDMTSLHGVPLIQTENKKADKNSEKRSVITENENSKATPKGSKPSIPTHDSVSSPIQPVEEKQEPRQAPVSGFSLVQAALDFIARQEAAEKSASSENSDKVVKKKITIEMPALGQIYDDENDSN